MEILVVGAGPVGLTLAVELARRGVSCRIIEKAPARAQTSRALIIWTRTLEMLEKMGCLPQVLEQGHMVHSTTIYNEQKRRMANVDFDRLDSPHPYAVVLPQKLTEEILESRLAEFNVRVEHGTELLSFETGESYVTATLKGPSGATEQMRTPWLIGCDGAHSKVRQELGLDFAGRDTSRVWALADVRLGGCPFVDEVVGYLHPDGVVLLLPIQPPLYRLIVDLKSGELSAPTLGEIQQAVIERCHSGITVKEPTWLTSFRLVERQLKEYRVGRVVLAGDAVRVHSPIGGQGMNTGIQDAMNLGWKLAMVMKSQAGIEPLLSSYTQERQPVGSMVVRATSLLSRAVGLQNPVATRMRDLLFALVANMEMVQRGVRQNTTELGVKYPLSPLSQERHDRHPVWRLGGGVPPGHRAPDGELFNRRLWELFCPTGFTMLLFEGLDALESEVPRIEEWAQSHLSDMCKTVKVPGWSQELHSRYGASESAVYLIRPDGYVGFRAQPAQLASLQEYFQLIGFQVTSSAGPLLSSAGPGTSLPEDSTAPETV